MFSLLFHELFKISPQLFDQKMYQFAIHGINWVFFYWVWYEPAKVEQLGVRVLPGLYVPDEAFTRVDRFDDIGLWRVEVRLKLVHAHSDGGRFKTVPKNRFQNGDSTTLNVQTFSEFFWQKQFEFKNNIEWPINNKGDFSV